MLKQFFVEFRVPLPMTEQFMKLIPEHRAKVNDFFNDEKLVSYTVSLDSGRIWAIFMAISDEDVAEMVESLPLTHLCHYKIHNVTFMNVVTSRIPAFSVN